MHDDRVLAPELKNKIMSAEQAACFIKTGMTIGYSGFAVGYPKTVPLSVYAKGEAKDLKVLCGAALTADTFRATGDSGSVSRFAAFQFVRNIREAINRGDIEFIDVHLGQFAEKIRRGYFGKIDYAIIECILIRQDGGLVPALSAGVVNALVECSDKIIIELNTANPIDLVGIHDFGVDPEKTMPNLLDRLGDGYLPCSPDKIAGIVITNFPDKDAAFRDTNELYDSIAGNIVDCLKKEISENRLPDDFTLQVGTGGVANAVLQGLERGGFQNLRMFTEVLTDGALTFLENGVFKEAATTCLDLSPHVQKKVTENPHFYKERIVIRPLEVTNNPKRINDMGLVAMNTAVEADIYGNINSSHAMGSKMINGIGGSNDFARFSRLSIFITPSTAKDGAISCIVPMVPHVDSTEHDTDIIATEYGYADLRGRSPKERVSVIIESCAHPDYRPMLRKYFDDAMALCGPCQTPHDLSQSLSWHLRLANTGTMKE